VNSTHQKKETILYTFMFVNGWYFILLQSNVINYFTCRIFYIKLASYI